MKKLEYWKYWLTIVSLVLVSIQIQAQNGWTHITDLPTPRVGASASVINNKIYVIGGCTAGLIDVANNEVYDPSTGSWDTLAPMPTQRGFLLTCVVHDSIYAIGGGYQTPTNKVEVYDPVTDTWTTKANMIYPWVGVYGGVVNDSIYTMGGYFNSRLCFKYNLSSWQQITSIPVGGCGGPIGATVYNGLVYTFGGTVNYPNNPLSYVNAYNPQTDTWDTSFAHMPTPRYALETYLIGDTIYAIGGSQSQGTALATVERFDPVTDTWETLQDMPQPYAFFAGAVVDRLIYVISGTPDWATGDGWVWVYDPSIPVELTSFTASANGKEVTLSWSTATEINNSGFEIERRIITGVISGDWNKIGFTPGFGTTTEPKEYSYVDNISGINANALAYRLKQVDFDGSFEYSDEVYIDKLTPVEFVLEQNYPNPFNPATTIGFGVQNKSSVKITVLNAIGEEVAVVLNEEREPGFYQVEFNATNLPSGVYFYQIRAGSFVETKKMILLK
ncbi:MAG: T9SS type A sorting domain-containing protein [Ignavibacteria bacterium]|nr:T9SS type A sorting domain-containing protein [Ignavibacteria bacterium]